MKKTVKVKYKGMPLSFPSIKVPSYADPLEVAFYLAKELKRTNPVDTGRSRRGWTVQGHKNGNVTVYNKVNYVQYLELGHSKQAPNGFIRQAISKTRSWMKTLQLEDEPKFEFTGKAVDRLLEAKTLKLIKTKAELESVNRTYSPTVSTNEEVIAKLIASLIEEGKANNTLPAIIKQKIRELLILFGIINDKT